MSNDALRREIKRLRDRVVERDFRAAAPPVDEDGLPDWNGDGLSVAAYERLLGDLPDEELSDEELETRNRLSPYAEVFERLGEKTKEVPDSAEEVEP